MTSFFKMPPGVLEAFSPSLSSLRKNRAALVYWSRTRFFWMQLITFPPSRLSHWRLEPQRWPPFPPCLWSASFGRQLVPCVLSVKHSDACCGDLHPLVWQKKWQNRKCGSKVTLLIYSYDYYSYFPEPCFIELSLKSCLNFSAGRERHQNCGKYPLTHPYFLVPSLRWSSDSLLTCIL